LGSAITAEDYQGARETVRQMGLNPDEIHHYDPTRA
jgi:hypothetical protein